MFDNGKFKGYTLIVVFDKLIQNILFCKRVKEPYIGLYNFVGGKIEEKEESSAGAYRELFEETGISQDKIKLSPMMKILYYDTGTSLEVYVGVLNENVELISEINPLKWFDINTDFYNSKVFAGEGNVAHIVSQALSRLNVFTKDRAMNIGIDGCKEGWIVANVKERRLYLKKCKDMDEISKEFSEVEEMLINMVVGLPESMGDIRPDCFARRILVGKSMAVFAVPCRQAVYADSEDEMVNLNKEILSKSLGRQVISIMPKIREIDEFLYNNPNFITRLKESHSEVCFSRLLGETVMTNKTKLDGITQRVDILSKYIDDFNVKNIRELAVKYKCSTGDILDSACLAVTANLIQKGQVQVIPELPMSDKRGILMRMTIPWGKINES
jgi:hydrolase, NUDIX family